MGATTKGIGISSSILRPARILVLLLVAAALGLTSPPPPRGAASHLPVREGTGTPSYTVLFHTDSGQARSPQASRDYVVWEDRRDEQSTIYAYDVRHDREFRVSQDDCQASSPSISHHLVVWASFCPQPAPRGVRRGDVFISKILGYQLSGQEPPFAIYEREHIWGSPPEDGGDLNALPKVDGNYVVWLGQYGTCWGCRGTSGAPMAHDLNTGETWELDTARSTSQVEISGRLAWWNLALYELDARTAHERPGSTLIAADGRLFTVKDEGFFEIDPRRGESTFIARIPHPSTGRLTPYAYSPELGVLIWARGTSSYQANLYAYDLRSGDEQQLTSTLSAGRSAVLPSVSGEVLAWEARLALGGRDTEVYVAKLASP